MMRGHVFASIIDAQAACEAINIASGYPKNGCETEAYCIAEQVGNTIFIQGDSFTESVLKSPCIDIELPQ